MVVDNKNPDKSREILPRPDASTPTFSLLFMLLLVRKPKCRVINCMRDVKALPDNYLQETG
jgi:hypothetical protein